MSLRKEQSEFMKHVELLLAFIHSNDFEVTGGELERTLEQQKIYFERGLTRTMDSYHLKKLAIDLNFFKKGKLITDKQSLQIIGDYWESLSKLNSWGGNWKSFYDPRHFERRWKN